MPRGQLKHYWDGLDPHCKGCRYANIAGGYCDYAGLTGRLRSTICPPGKYCTVKEVRKKGGKNGTTYPTSEGLA